MSGHNWRPAAECQVDVPAERRLNDRWFRCKNCGMFFFVVSGSEQPTADVKLSYPADPKSCEELVEYQAGEIAKKIKRLYDKAGAHNPYPHVASSVVQAAVLAKLGSLSDDKDV